MPGIGLAGAYGAGGAGDALTQLLARRFAETEFAERQRQARASEERQVRLDAQATEDRAFTRSRAAKSDERTDRLDAEAREDKDSKQAIDMATLFPGKVVSGETLRRVPKHLQELIAKPREAQLASRSIGGTAVAGDPNAGDIDIEEHDAIAPGSFELQMPVSERMRIAAERNSAAETKRSADERFRQEKLDRDTQHHERMAEIAAQRASGAGRGTGPLVRVTYTDPDTGQTFEQDMTREEARALGPRAKPMAAKDRDAGNAMTDYVKKIDEAITLGDKSGWAGTGFIVGRTAGAFGGKFASEDALNLRGLIGDLFAENAHERFGGALTTQEIARAKAYLAEATDDPKKIKVNLQRMKGVVAPALERWQARKGASAPSGGDPGRDEQEFDLDPKTGALTPRKR
jgi:hypothetical protein